MQTSPEQLTMPSKRLDAPLLTMVGLSLLGFADSAYLTLGHYLTLPLPCSVTHGCETVLTSPYAMVGPIPLAFFGVVFYLVLGGLALTQYASAEPSSKSVVLIFTLTALGLLASIGFASLQAFVINAFCMYCLGSAVITLLLFFAGLWLARARAKRS